MTLHFVDLAKPEIECFPGFPSLYGSELGFGHRRNLHKIWNAEIRCHHARPSYCSGLRRLANRWSLSRQVCGSSSSSQTGPSASANPKRGGLKGYQLIPQAPRMTKLATMKDRGRFQFVIPSPGSCLCGYSVSCTVTRDNQSVGHGFSLIWRSTCFQSHLRGHRHNSVHLVCVTEGLTLSPDAGQRLLQLLSTWAFPETLMSWRLVSISASKWEGKGVIWEKQSHFVTYS